MTEWTAFVGLTGAVLTAFLGLARLSQQVVGDGEGSERRAVATREPPRGPTAPESPREPTATEPDAERPARPSARTDREPDAPDRSPEPTPDGRDQSPEPVPDGATARSNDRRGPPPGSPAHETLRGDEERSLSAGALLANVALTQGLFGAALLGGAWYFQIPGWALGVGAGTLPSLPVAGIVGVAFGLALWIGNEVASALLDTSGVDYDEGLRAALAPDGAVGWAVLLGATLPIIAVVEEFLFRAAAIGATAAAFDTSPWALAVVSSAAFALGHGAQGRAGIAVTGVLGLALAGGFVLTESLLVVAVAHYLVNALEFVVHEGLGYPDPVWK